MSANVETWRTTRRDITRIHFQGPRVVCPALQVESTPKAQDVRVFMEPNEETDGKWQQLVIVTPDGATVEIRGTDFYWIDVRRPDGSLAGYVSTDPEQSA